MRTYKNPDSEAFDFNHRSGEFSLEADERFEKHLKHLKEKVEGKRMVEPMWYTHRPVGFSPFDSTVHDICTKGRASGNQVES